jgi:glycosyltransferase involved in cell wall biosynthesis
MSAAQRNDSWRNEALRTCWRSLQTANVVASSLTSGISGDVRVFYGGARQGDLGGPLVKVKRLREHFPESRWRYNLVYALSNAAYLSAGALAWLKMRHVPIVLNQNGVFYPGWYAGDWQKMNAQMGLAYHRADHVFWQSDFCRRAADQFLGRREEAGEVLFNAIDTLRFCPAQVHQDRPFTFLLTGKIDAHLGYRLESSITGLRAARDGGLPARLLIAGQVADTVLEASLRQVNRLGLEGDVDFLGAYTQETAPAIYQRADAYIMTKYLDPCPNTVLEAMASGLPVLYSASGGVPELVGPLAGIALPVPERWDEIAITPTPEEIGKGMIEVARGAPAMSAAARQRAEDEFEITRWIERHRQVFRRLLESKN